MVVCLNTTQIELSAVIWEAGFINIIEIDQGKRDICHQPCQAYRYTEAVEYRLAHRYSAGPVCKVRARKHPDEAQSRPCTLYTPHRADVFLSLEIQDCSRLPPESELISFLFFFLKGLYIQNRGLVLVVVVAEACSAAVKRGCRNSISCSRSRPHLKRCPVPQH